MKHNDNSGSRTRAIQTRYKGYHFRSRLEARYAVFFDTLGIKWEYEKQGFDLRRGIGPYLPDFRVYTADSESTIEGAWVEIKGELTGDCWSPTVEEQKLQQLTEETGFNSYLCVGIPDLEETRVSIFINCENCGTSWVREKTIFGLASNYQVYHRGQNDLEVIDAACTAAKSARFEYGETPRIR